MWPDHWIAAGLAGLVAWILLSGLDDLFIGLVFLWNGRKQFEWPAKSELDEAAERRIAIFVPLWREHAVIRQMLERNLATIHYRNYDIFVGVYPNDHATIEAVGDAVRLHGRLHMAVCPHDGPTSKGDCLNWIHRRMVEHEESHGVRFDIIVTHDAEDLVHRESLRLINWGSRDYDMVQIPVLPIATRLDEFTHGLYCDEFAEYQMKDIPVRQILGGFLPSNGVGTGFSRDALERLAAGNHGRWFDPACLTEDYENGFRLHEMGCRQLFVPVRLDDAGPAATREYFPRRWRAAMRQRSRWVAGITLQSWQRHGWRGGWRQMYWLWRDRKGLIGNLLSPVSNLCTIFVGGSYLWSRSHGLSWGPAVDIPPAVAAATMIVAAAQSGLRMWCCSRIYSWRFAALAPLRAVWGNAMNSAATVSAIQQFVAAKLGRRTVAWSKTEHTYPEHYGAGRARPLLGEVLVRMRCLSMGDLESALDTCPAGTRFGEHLLELEKISEDDLYRALSSQSGIPLGLPHAVNRRALRTLPAEAARRWRVLPYRMNVGQIHVVTADLPSPEMLRELSIFSSMEVRFRLVLPREFEALAREYLPVA